MAETKIAAAVGVATTSKPKEGSNEPHKGAFVAAEMHKAGRALMEEGVTNPKLARRRMRQAKREGIRKHREAMTGE